MKYYFAPLEGITGHVFRRTYDRFFGGIDAYYTPFVTTRDGGIMKKKELRDILPENNPGITLIPQIMTTKANEFVQAATHMQELGYTEVNLNLGCPSGTVVPKGKGSGFLREPEKLDRFLYEIYEKCPLAISIKARIGFHSPDEFPALLDIFKKYPMRMLILHLRTREEWYEGDVHPETFRYAWEELERGAASTGADASAGGSGASASDGTGMGPQDILCYNGDVKTAEDVERLRSDFPELQRVMIGRGFLSHPGFAGNDSKKADYTDRKVVLEFIRGLQEEYEKVLYGEIPVLFKMKEMWSHLIDSFPEDEKLFKRIKKTKHLREYEAVIAQISA